MKQLMDALAVLREDALVYGQAVMDLVSDRRVREDPRYGCFFLIHNRIIVTQEVLNHFLMIWRKFDPDLGPDSLRKLRAENTERCIEITRSLFIGCMSVVEHCAKRSIDLYPNSRLAERLIELRSRNRYIFLKGIIQESGDLGLIPAQQVKEWEDVILLRNLAVHNNSISDSDLDIKLGGREFRLRKGEMMRGDLDTYVFLARRGMELFHRWIFRLDNDSPPVLPPRE